MRAQIKWRLSDEEIKEDEDEELKDPEVRAGVKCTIFLGYTSNMISCGVREVLRFLAQHNMVDVMVTTGGGIEEDFLKCLAPHFVGDFALKGTELRKKGINRIGNMLVPNKNYCLFEDWFQPVLNAMHDEQEKDVREPQSLSLSVSLALSISLSLSLSADLLWAACAGHCVDTLQDHPPHGQGDQPPGQRVLLGVQAQHSCILPRHH